MSLGLHRVRFLFCWSTERKCLKYLAQEYALLKFTLSEHGTCNNTKTTCTCNNTKTTSIAKWMLHNYIIFEVLDLKCLFGVCSLSLKINWPLLLFLTSLQNFVSFHTNYQWRRKTEPTGDEHMTKYENSQGWVAQTVRSHTILHTLALGSSPTNSWKSTRITKASLQCWPSEESIAHRWQSTQILALKPRADMTRSQK